MTLRDVGLVVSGAHELVWLVGLAHVRLLSVLCSLKHDVLLILHVLPQLHCALRPLLLRNQLVLWLHDDIGQLLLENHIIFVDAVATSLF